ncbi:MAG: zinc ribbon domain-containing protein, partial [Lachnospiraceae bacterium]|nr:zinc ribbon domain-containing protein [Lachnospiraceae bacterium]
MALIRCPECGGQVSDKAAACIHCGCPLNISREKTFKIIFVNFTTSSPKLQSRIIDGFSKFIYID